MKRVDALLASLKAGEPVIYDIMTLYPGLRELRSWECLLKDGRRVNVLAFTAGGAWLTCEDTYGDCAWLVGVTDYVG